MLTNMEKIEKDNGAILGFIVVPIGYCPGIDDDVKFHMAVG